MALPGLRGGTNEANGALSESESESESVSERAVEGAALLAEMVCTEESRTCRELTARRAEHGELATKEGTTDGMV